MIIKRSSYRPALDRLPTDSASERHKKAGAQGGRHGGLSPQQWQEIILGALMIRSPRTSADLATSLGCGKFPIRINLTALINRGEVVRSGSRGHWVFGVRGSA